MKTVLAVTVQFSLVAAPVPNERRILAAVYAIEEAFKDLKPISR